MIKDKSFLDISSKTLKEEKSSQLVRLAQYDETKRSSIETTLHSLTLKYTLHTHPIVVNMICNQPEWNKILKKIFQDENIMTVIYQTPGIELALEIKKITQKI